MGSSTIGKAAAAAASCRVAEEELAARAIFGSSQSHTFTLSIGASSGGDGVHTSEVRKD